METIKFTVEINVRDLSQADRKAIVERVFGDVEHENIEHALSSEILSNLNGTKHIAPAINKLRSKQAGHTEGF